MTLSVGETTAHYWISFPWFILIPPALLLLAGSMAFWFDPLKVGVPLVAVIFGSGICWLNIVLAKEGFEEWIQRAGWAAGEPSAVPLPADPAAVVNAGETAARQVLEQHERATLRWQTALAVAIPFGVLVVGSLFALQFRAENRARANFRRELASLTAHREAEVLINGRRLTDAALFLQIMNGVRHVEAHHSSPVRQLRLTVQSPGEVLDFVLGQDSERADEFWVIERGEEVGRIRDSRLRAILSDVSKDIR